MFDLPTTPGPYWCRYGTAVNWNAIVFLAGQAPLLQVVGLHLISEDYSPRTRFLRTPDIAEIKFGPAVTLPPDPPTSPQ